MNEQKQIGPILEHQELVGMHSQIWPLNPFPFKP